MIYTPFAVDLHDQPDISREPPRPMEHRSEAYDQSFDSKTLIYDTVQLNGDSALAIGPPLLSLSQLVETAMFLTDGGKVMTSQYMKRDRLGLFSLKRTYNTSSIKMKFAGIEKSARIQTSLTHLFSGRKVMFTLSRNNNLQWIEDWARFYAVHHGIDGVLFYDNFSDFYSSEDILRRLEKVAGLKQIVVVNWPYKYGPKGAPGFWDSDFCQYGVMEHAKRLFLGDADLVLNCDVDEIIIAQDGISLAEHLAQSSRPIMQFPGFWIRGPRDVIFDPKRSEAFRHRDFIYADEPTNLACKPKWALRPKDIDLNKQWKVHSIEGAGNRFLQDHFLLRHYAALIVPNLGRVEKANRRLQAAASDGRKTRIDDVLQKYAIPIWSDEEIFYAQDP
ncbi:hypothetical protein [Roseovarius salinarum]|uniref:hypothetical protein n=1 Tax=Roseovarius salinarum TaxID=1981892 RepID=UPI00130003D1|nr:hypothetical protein [Roseovarius salinarum]